MKSKRFIFKIDGTWKIGRETIQPEGRSITGWKACSGKWKFLEPISFNHNTLKSILSNLKNFGLAKGKRISAAYPVYEIVEVERKTK